MECRSEMLCKSCNLIRVGTTEEMDYLNEMTQGVRSELLRMPPLRLPSIKSKMPRTAATTFKRYGSLQKQIDIQIFVNTLLTNTKITAGAHRWQLPKCATS